MLFYVLLCCVELCRVVLSCSSDYCINSQSVMMMIIASVVVVEIIRHGG